VWEIPEPRSAHEVRHEDGSRTVVRRHGNPAGPRLLLSHGNGLAIDFYYPFWSLLTDDFDLILYDMRNHGWNAVGSRAEHNFPNLVRDQNQVVEEVEAHYGAKPMAGVFHSLSALGTLVAPDLGALLGREVEAQLLQGSRHGRPVPDRLLHEQVRVPVSCPGTRARLRRSSR